MVAAMSSVVECLELQPAEISGLKAAGKKKVLLLGREKHTRSPSEESLRAKLRKEARRRGLKQKLESLPSDDDIEIFSMYLQVAAAVVKDDCNKLIDYLGYKEAVAKSSKVLQDFLPRKIFIDLLQISDETKSDGLVPVDSIINYIILRKRKMMNLISLHYYDSLGKGYLTGEVVAFSIFACSCCY
ncbi:unnamed protein product [Gongylonema pulchrum]|uniref:EF-hand domain-containing protein n=1 Tax=Gongylonema pulchrum TaxID=637853 RepID=A0A183EMA0_9BILA|nr:unnamed protein product [Gongylonema pulchrum]